MKKLILLIGICSYFPMKAQNNTSYGMGAGNTGLNNTSVGYDAGTSVTGSNNSFFGTRTGQDTNTGIHNSFYGAFAGEKNTSGHRNTYSGTFSGRNAIIGQRNSFYGYNSGLSTNSDQNSFFGAEAGTSNSSGSKNVFMGSYAGRKNISGSYNVFMGTESGYNNLASQNVFLGYRAGFGNTTGEDNIYAGNHTGYGNTTGSRNTYIGISAGSSSIGSNNVFIGHGAGINEQESNKLHIGSLTRKTLIYGDFSKSHVAIGGIPTAQEQDKYAFYVFGESYSTVAWSASDDNFKTNKKNINQALSKINALSGSSYEYKRDLKTNESNKVLQFPEGRQLGFIAQEIKEVLPEVVRVNGDGTLAVNYSGVIPVLTEAIKELDQKYIARIESLEMEIATLSQLVNKVEVETKDESSNEVKGNLSDILMNVPNPGKNFTSIWYKSQSDSENVQVTIFDLQGKIIKTFTDLRSSGEIQVNSSEIGTGMFHYALIIDGKLISTNKMILQ